MLFKVLIMKELNLRSKILSFCMEFNLDLVTLSLSFFDISMLLYVWEIGEIGRT